MLKDGVLLSQHGLGRALLAAAPRNILDECSCLPKFRCCASKFLPTWVLTEASPSWGCSGQAGEGGAAWGRLWDGILPLGWNSSQGKVLRIPGNVPGAVPARSTAMGWDFRSLLTILLTPGFAFSSSSLLSVLFLAVFSPSFLASSNSPSGGWPGCGDGAACGGTGLQTRNKSRISRVEWKAGHSTLFPHLRTLLFFEEEQRGIEKSLPKSWSKSSLSCARD